VTTGSLRAAELDDLYAIPIPTSTSMSPDGGSVAYAVKRADPTTDSEPSTVWIAAATGEPSARRLTDGTADYAPQFAPDGEWIAFLRRQDSAAQLHRVTLSTGEVTPLTTGDRFPRGVGLPAHSPDGTRVAFTAAVGRAGSSLSGAAPLVTDRLGYKADGRGRLGAVRRHLFVLDLTSGEILRLTDGDWDASAPTWSPDGRRLAFFAATEPDSDLTLRQTLHHLTVDSPESRPVPLHTAGSIVGPLVWTPDGAAIVAVVATQFHVGPHDLVLRPLDEDAPELNLTARLDRHVMPGASAHSTGSLALTPDGAGVLYCLRERGWTQLHRIGLDGGSSTALVADDNQVITGLSVASGAARASFVLTDQESFGEVAVIDVDGGTVRAITDLTREALPEVELLAPAQRTFDISDGTSVHGWLLRRDDARGPGPLLLDVHGGPHGAWSGVAVTRNLYHQVLAQRGWSILTLNPRGSDGYGQEFLREVIGGWGSADQADLLEPVDQLVAEGVADPQLLAVTGYSYGGFSVCHLTANDTRFAAAVAGGLICDFGSLLGGSDVGLFFIEEQYLANPVTDQQRLLEMSPIARAGNVTTPTLVLHGEDDQRCPVNQGERWFSTLRTMGVPTRLVVYPGESHLFLGDGRPSYRIDYGARLIDWLERYTTEGATT
jgi:dipeptidyl aminopeptidase/acylaminoacyl peptidase